tara:strand:- start:2438 stop:3370 length:933 start_codon:yes stop_codon:yes gene_type:complete
MHKLLKTMTFTAILGSTNLFASDGVFLFTERPDQPSQSIVYETSPALRVNAHGYVQDDNDRFLVGWNMQNGMLHDPLNWDMSRNNLSLVSYLDSTLPIQQTSFLQSSFTLPLNDAIGASYQHQWSVIDNMGSSHDLVATFTKNAAATWFVSLGSPDALSVVRDYAGGVAIDAVNPLVLNFDASNYLLSIDGMPSSPMVYIQWDPAKTTAYDSSINLDLGPVGMPTSTRIEDGAFGVSQSSQDGSAPSEPVSARVDASGVLRTVYADGSEGDSFQLGYVSLGMDISSTVVRAPLDSTTQTAVNAIFPVVAP